MATDMMISEADEKEFSEFLHAQIREYNDSQSPHHRQAHQPGGVKPLHVILKDAAGKMIGGLVASTYWDGLEIAYLFVPDSWRRRGIGTALLQAAEAAAVEGGAKQAFLTTFEFQARAFYEGHGYTVVGKLAGYPPGSAYYWMRKDLAPQGQDL